LTVAVIIDPRPWVLYLL